MGHHPTLHSDEFYALMNAHDGKFLRYDSSTSDFDIGKPDKSGSDLADFLILLNNTPSSSTLTVELEVPSSTPQNIALDRRHDSIQAAGKKDTDSKQQWEVSVGHSGIYQLVLLCRPNFGSLLTSPPAT